MVLSSLRYRVHSTRPYLRSFVRFNSNPTNLPSTRFTIDIRKKHIDKNFYLDNHDTFPPIRRPSRSTFIEPAKDILSSSIEHNSQVKMSSPPNNPPGGNLSPPFPPSPPSDDKDKEKERDKLSIYKRFKTFMKQYGMIGLGTYWITWGGVFTGFYWAFESGIVDYTTWKFLHLDQMEEWYLSIAPKFGVDTDLHPITPKTESALVALMAAKVTKPLQWIFVWGITPPIARSLGYAPIPKKTMRDKLKDKIDDAMKPN